ncbi:MAG: hypothetical protein LBJ72_12925 [Dysgonamonadaceae bacterium]|jgi:hypothetical protein|nr:hypothetical protein [Dysgonamonadaceae bacterium]
MKKIYLLLLFLLGNIGVLFAQNYLFEYDVTFKLKQNKKRYYIHEAGYKTFNNSETKELSSFKFSQIQSDRRVAGSLRIPASSGFIKEIIFLTARQDQDCALACWWDNECRTEAVVFRTTSSETTCFDLRGKSIDWKCLNNGATVTKFQCYPELSINTSKYTITDAEKLTVQATAGFPSHVYKWKYATNYDPYSSSYNWQNVPGSCYTNDRFEAGAGDLLGAAGVMGMLGKNLFLCIDLGCDKLSNLLTISVKGTAPGIESVVTENVKCPGEGNGHMILNLDRELLSGEKIEVFMTAEGGIENSDAPFDIIDNKTLKVKDLYKGTYSIRIYTNYNGYSFEAKSNSQKSNIVIGESAPVSFAINGQQTISCRGESDGSFKVGATGGTPGYTLKWRLQDDTDYMETDNMEVSGLPAGIYEFYVIDSNGCEPKDNEGFIDLKTVEFTDPDLLTLTHLEDKSGKPSGNGLSNGYVTVKVEGGTPAYTMVWKKSGTGSVLTTVENSSPGGVFESKLKDVPAGDYTVTVTDANGCRADIDMITIEEPFVIKGNVVQTASILCNGEKASLSVTSVTGGVPGSPGNPYNFEWYRFTSTTDSVYIGNQSSVGNLDPGKYVVTITDFSNPVNMKNLYYTVDGPDPLSASASSGNVSCYDGNDGSIVLNITGGTKPYYLSYAKDGGGYSNVTSSAPYHDIYLDLSAGAYSLMLEDQNNCPALINGNSVETITITQPGEAFEIVSQRVKNPTGTGRSDGMINVKVDGGLPFSSDPKYHVVWRSSSGIITAENTIEDGVFSSTVKNLPKGNYRVEINGETHPGSSGPCVIDHQITLEEPKPLSAVWKVSKAVSCYESSDGEITADISGGVPNDDWNAQSYHYAWYTVEESVETPIDGATGKVLSDIGAGRYKVTVTDYSDPVNTKDFYYTLTEPGEMGVTVSPTPVSCFNGNNGLIKVNVTGGTSPYKLFYKHDTDDDYSNLASTGSFTANNLISGDYSVYVTDKNNCRALINGNTTDVTTVEQPGKGLSVVSQNIRRPSGQGRADGYIILKIDGGTPFTSGPFYNVVWRDEYGYPIAAENTVGEDNLFTTSIKELPKGIYRIEVKDQLYSGQTGGCYLSFSIDMEEPEPIKIELENTKTVDCFGFRTGELVVHASGGIPFLDEKPYIYKWYKVENDQLNEDEEALEILIPNQNDSVLSGIGVGFYKVRIEDSCLPPNTNEETPVFEITEPPLLVTKPVTDDISCFDGRTGLIHISVSGGVGGYTMHSTIPENADEYYHPIQESETTGLFRMDNLIAGDYKVYIRDANACYAKINQADTATISLIQPERALSIDTVLLVHPSGFEESNGSVEIRISGGTPFSDGSYTVVWKNRNNGTLTSTGVTTTEGESYISIVKNLPDGEYTVEIRDANYFVTDDAVSNRGCIFIEKYTLIQPEPFKAEIKESYITCYGYNDGILTVSAKGGVPNPKENETPYKYQWYKRDKDGRYQEMAGENGASLTGLDGGIYLVKIEDYSWQPNTLSLIYQLVEPEALRVSTTNVDILCGQTVTVSAEVSGGTFPYDYQWSNGAETSSLEGMYPGVYMVFVKDAHGCTVTATSKITSPGDVKLTGTVSDPVCYQGSTGKVITSVSGGSFPYAYQWSNDSSDKDLTGVKAGIYSVNVIDKDGCATSESFTLTDPEPIKLELGEDRIICLGQTYEPEPVFDDPASALHWTGDNGFNSDERHVTLDRAGTYRLTITDSKGCQATDEIRIETKDYRISCEMVVTSSTAVNDTVIIVNISYPEPDRVEWIFSPDDPIEVIETTSELAMVIFKKEGTYDIGLRSFVADCFLDVVKPVSITKSGEKTIDDFGVTDVQKFVIYPNPSKGVFKADVELNKSSGIRLRLISLSQGFTLSNEIRNNSDKYTVDYNKKLAAGVYILMLETPSSRKSLKLIVH